jgi:hypothetical protein
MRSANGQQRLFGGADPWRLRSIHLGRLKKKYFRESDEGEGAEAKVIKLRRYPLVNFYDT